MVKMLMRSTVSMARLRVWVALGRMFLAGVAGAAELAVSAQFSQGGAGVGEWGGVGGKWGRRGGNRGRVVGGWGSGAAGQKGKGGGRGWRRGVQGRAR